MKNLIRIQKNSNEKCSQRKLIVVTKQISHKLTVQLRLISRICSIASTSKFNFFGHV